jgi:hypothetical protein
MLNQVNPVTIINLEWVFGIEQVRVKPLTLAWAFWHVVQRTTRGTLSGCL